MPPPPPWPFPDPHHIASFCSSMISQSTSVWLIRANSKQEADPLSFSSSRSTCPLRISPLALGMTPFLPSALPWMEATKPQERKGLFWEAKVACSLKQYPTLLAELRFVIGISRIGSENPQSVVMPPCLVIYLFLQKDDSSVRRLWSQFQLSGSWLHCFYPGVLHHFQPALVLSVWEEQPSTPWNLSYGEPPPGFYHGSSLIMAGGLKCFCFTSSQSNGFSFSHVFSYCLPQVMLKGLVLWRAEWSRWWPYLEVPQHSLTSTQREPHTHWAWGRA